MNNLGRLESLLALQKKRVDSAMAVVIVRNEALRQRVSERELARAQAEEAAAGYRLEQQRLTEAVLTGAIGHIGIQAVRLTSASLRCEMQRTLLDRTAQSLVASNDLVTAADAAAAGARTAYRRTLARQDALIALQKSLRKTEMQRVQRLEEQEA
jgi:hypothetical protein